MDLNLGNFKVPAASIAAFSYLALTLFIPLYDLVLVPAVQKITKIEGGITMLQRQGIGIVLASFSMVVAGLVEHKRRNSALASGGTSPLTAFWLAPQLIITGLAESFNAIGQIELYNTQFPEHMQTLAMALFYTTEGGASYLATLTTNIINKVTKKNGIGWVNDNITAGRLDYFYYFLAIFAIVDLIYFLFCAHFYRYKVKKPEEDDDSSSETDDIEGELSTKPLLKSNIRSLTSPQMVRQNKAMVRLDRIMTT
ncbi:hypothetical protein LUZ60_015690 [Juncus effusus]|nr:hypothetical protein LUZ60_015690 [Juncus effusus]